MLNKKGAIGLAVNTIVVIIIALVILGTGLTLMRGWVSGAEDIKAQLDAQTEAELERLLTTQGKKVALPLHTTTIEAGETHIFGLGILNINDETYGESFTVDITLSKVLDSDTDDDISDSVSSSEAIEYLLYDAGPITIAENQYQKELILVNMPEDAAKGTYIYNVKVYDTKSEQYDNTKKFYVTVV